MIHVTDQPALSKYVFVDDAVMINVTVDDADVLLTRATKGVLRSGRIFVFSFAARSAATRESFR